MTEIQELIKHWVKEMDYLDSHMKYLIYEKCVNEDDVEYTTTLRDMAMVESTIKILKKVNGLLNNDEDC